MDAQTISAYNTASAQYARDWQAQPAPDDLYQLFGQYFKPGGQTVDIGCGSGREVAWLAANAYAASGYDASEGLLREARALHPGLPFGLATLPELAGVPAAAYDNVVCETVIMHLDPPDVGPSTRALLGLLRPAGTLYLSWRVTDGDSTRDAGGRLYAAFDKQRVLQEVGNGYRVLVDQEEFSLSSGKKIHRLIVRMAEAQP